MCPATREATAPPEPRLFVGLWPREHVRRALTSYQGAWTWPSGARLMEPESLHVTLHFIGAYPSHRIPRLREAIAEACVPRFNLEFGACEVWPGGIAIVHVRPNSALSALHRRVGAQLQGLGIALDSRPFSPHVTLARRAAGASMPNTALDVTEEVTAMVLAESVRAPTPHYEHLQIYRFMQ